MKLEYRQRALYIVLTILAYGACPSLSQGESNIIWIKQHVSGMSRDNSVLVGNTSSTLYYHAFRMTTSDNALQDLGTLGGNTSYASSTNNDGSVVVGTAYFSNDNFFNYRAFRWTLLDNKMHDLGTLHRGTSSEATDVNGDGSIIVGNSIEYIFGRTWDRPITHAFRWTLSDNTMHYLGTLPGGNYWDYSSASGINNDGSVVVGTATTVDGNYHAFRWTEMDNTMYDLGTLGGLHSNANGVNLDGSVIVGSSCLPTIDQNRHAFRWTLYKNTMDDLGTLGGKESYASAVNGDGSVIVGSSLIESATVEVGAPPGGEQLYWRAFRWTVDSGMESVEDWLIANGGSPLPPGNSLNSADGVSENGQIIFGSGYFNETNQTYIASVIPGFSFGILGMSDFRNSLNQPIVAGAVLHERMRNAISPDVQDNAPSHGQFALSAHGIYDNYDDDNADGDGWSGVFKLIYGISDTLRTGVSYISAGERLDMEDDGSMKNDIDIFGLILSYGDYKGDGLLGRLSFDYGTGDADLTRSYLAGSVSDDSYGDMGVDQYGFAMEIGYGFLLAQKTLVTPLVSYEWVRSNLDSYTETGGTFPASFDERTINDSYARTGVKVKQAVVSTLDLDFGISYVVRLSSNDNPVSGSLAGLGSIGGFNQKLKLSKDWLELKTGLDYSPEFISKDMHVTLGFQVNCGQEFDVPEYRIDSGLVFFF